MEGYALCGTRGWLFDADEPHDEKVMNREIGRLRLSLDAAEPGREKLVFLHYPPVYTGADAPRDRGRAERVRGQAVFFTPTCTAKPSALRCRGEVDGIRYKLVSADGLHFCPYKIT